jgi:O-antigen/teichoic acid export membrane protein
MGSSTQSRRLQRSKHAFKGWDTLSETTSSYQYSEAGQHSEAGIVVNVPKARRLSLNAIALLTTSLLTSAAGFLIVAYIGRYLGAAVFGEYMVAYSWYFLLTPVANLGLPSLLIRRLSRLRSSLGPFVARSQVVVFLSGTVCGLAMWTGASILGYSSSTMQAILLLAATMGLTSALPVLQGVLVSQERAEIVLLSGAVESIVRAGASLILIRLGYGVVWLVGAFVMSHLLSVAICLAFLTRYGHIGWRAGEGAEFSLVWLLREALPFAGIAWLNVAYWRIGLLILSQIQGEVAVGVYSAANKLFQILQFVPESILTAFLPRLSRGFVRARPAFENLIELGLRYLLVASILPALLMTFAARPVLRFTYQLAAFQEATLVLYILAWALLPYAARRFLVRLMMAANWEWPLVGLLTCSTVAGLVLNVALVQRLGALGLAIATVLNLAGTSGLLGWFVTKHLELSTRVLDWRRLARLFLVASVAGAIGVVLLKLGWFVAVVGCTVGYVALALLLQPVSLEEIGLGRFNHPWRRPAVAKNEGSESTPAPGIEKQCTEPTQGENRVDDAGQSTRGG